MDLSSRLVWTSNGFPKERFLSMAFTRIFEEEKQTSENSRTDWFLETSSKESNNSFFNNSDSATARAQNKGTHRTAIWLPGSDNAAPAGSELTPLDAHHCWQEVKQTLLTTACCSGSSKPMRRKHQSSPGPSSQAGTIACRVLLAPAGSKAKVPQSRVKDGCNSPSWLLGQVSMLTSHQKSCENGSSCSAPLSPWGTP